MYDPNKATLIGSNGDDGTSLYRKRTGEYFLHRMSVHESTPVAYDDASAWAKECLPIDIWENEFGDIPNDDTKVDMLTRLPASSYRKLVRATSRLGKTKEQILRELIDTL